MSGEINITDDDRRVLGELAESDGNPQSVIEDNTYPDPPELPDGPSQRITPRECLQMRILYGRGWKPGNVAAFMYRSYDATRRHLKRECDCDPVPEDEQPTLSSRTFTRDVDCYRMRIMRSLGVKMADVADTFGCSVGTARKHVNDRCGCNTPDPVKNEPRATSGHLCAVYRLCVKNEIGIQDENYGVVNEHVRGRCSHVIDVNKITKKEKELSASITK